MKGGDIAMSLGFEMMEAMLDEYLGDEPYDEPITYWKMRGGKIIAIKDMTTSHLINTIKFLKRQIDGSARDDWCYDNISAMEEELKNRGIILT